jgi:hypothetical protein
MNGRKRWLHEKTSAAAAPRKPKKGAVSSPLNVDDIFFLLLLLLRCRESGAPLPRPPSRRRSEVSRFGSSDLVVGSDLIWRGGLWLWVGWGEGKGRRRADHGAARGGGRFSLFQSTREMGRPIDRCSEGLFGLNLDQSCLKFVSNI